MDIAAFLLVAGGYALLGVAALAALLGCGRWLLSTLAPRRRRPEDL